ncbi:MAG: EamA family transporter [Verrucomicrobiota bacterium]
MYPLLGEETGGTAALAMAKKFWPVSPLLCDGLPMNNEPKLNSWFWYAVGAAVLYGLHQIFTKLASNRISDGLGGFVVEGSAAMTILVYLAFLKFGGHWNQTSSTTGVIYSVLTGICVGVGTLFFFLLFQKGGPLSAVPMILAGGAALMAIAGIFFFKEPPSPTRILGIVLSLAGLFLLKK